MINKSFHFYDNSTFFYLSYIFYNHYPHNAEWRPLLINTITSGLVPLSSIFIPASVLRPSIQGIGCLLTFIFLWESTQAPFYPNCGLVNGICGPPTFTFCWLLLYYVAHNVAILSGLCKKKDATRHLNLPALSYC